MQIKASDGRSSELVPRPESAGRLCQSITVKVIVHPLPRTYPESFPEKNCIPNQNVPSLVIGSISSSTLLKRLVPLV